MYVAEIYYIIIMVYATIGDVGEWLGTSLGKIPRDEDQSLAEF